MKPLACCLVVATFMLAGCGPESGRIGPGQSPPTAVSRIDAMELWASPPAAVNWDDTPGPDGVQVRLYAFQISRSQPVLVDGAIEFRLYAGRMPAGGAAPTPFKVWRYSSDDLAVRRFRNMIGWGYATRLGWGGPVPDAPLITVQAVYQPADGPEVYSAPVSIALPKTTRAGPTRSLLGQADGTGLRPSKADRPIRFRRQVIDASPPGAQHVFTLLADLNGNGRPDVITGSKRGPFTLIWYENPSWTRHPMARADGLGPSAALLDVNRDGRTDLVAGSPEGIYWFEHPADPAEVWPQHLIDNRLKEWRTLAAGDVDGDGRSELVVLAGEDGPLVVYAPPAKPAGEGPWPEEMRREVVAKTGPGRGLAVSDLDADRSGEILTASAVYRRTPDGKAWRASPFAEGYALTHLAVADLDGDARPEIVGCEGEKHPGRLVWFKGPAWSPHPLREDLFHPRTLVLTDVDADGRPDVVVAETGLGQNERPRIFLYRNHGAGGFQETLVDQGTPTHNAQAADLTRDGRPDLVGAPYGPERHVDLWVNLGE